MKISRANLQPPAARRSAGNDSPIGRRSAFTLIEIALCLAIIGFALLAIMVVLPYGLGAQKDNREETVVGQDAGVLLELIRSGSRGADDLTNYVYAITISRTAYSSLNVVSIPTIYECYSNVPVGFAPTPYGYLTSGQRIIGLMSTPRFTDFNGHPIITLANGGISNHVVAYVRSLSGIAAEKPPQNNDIMRDDSFAYQVVCINAPFEVDTNIFALPFEQQRYSLAIAQSMRDIRLKFRWPQRPNGNPANANNAYAADKTFRVTVPGLLEAVTNDNGLPLYFYQSQTFTNNLP